MFSRPLINEATQLISDCRDAQLRIALAESCTGGLIGGLLTEISGASSVLDCGFVTYSNDAKISLLGVNPELIEMHGAVSELVALEMAEGALTYSSADLSVSVTGVAGPHGGSDEKPVGLVHFGCAKRGGPSIHDQEIFDGSRSEIRLAAVAHAIRLLMSRL